MPGRGLKLIAHLDATTKCEALVAIFTKNGQIAAGLAPQFVDLLARSEVLLPKSAAAWKWERDEESIQVYVLFFPPGSKDSAELRTLVNAMQDSKSEAISKLQVNKLHELVGRAKVDKVAAAHVAQANTEVAGVMRMVVGFEWRDSARAVNFSADKPGALIFPAADGK